MTELTTIDEVEAFIAKYSLSFLYISRTNCSVCHALLPQIQELLVQFPDIQMGYINADHLEEIAGRFSIFTVPVLLFFLDGKEVIREARFVHLEILKEKLAKLYDAIQLVSFHSS